MDVRGQSTAKGNLPQVPRLGGKRAEPTGRRYRNGLFEISNALHSGVSELVPEKWFKDDTAQELADIPTVMGSANPFADEVLEEMERQVREGS